MKVFFNKLNNILNITVRTGGSESPGIIDKENDIVYKRILVIEIIKRALSARYIFSIVKSKKGVRECNNLMRQCLDFDGNIKYWILYKIPFLYRAFRLLTDPTMLEYEK